MAKAKKQRRPRAEAPKGFRDWFGAEVTARDGMLRRIAEVYERHGFEALETPAVETVEALGKFLPDTDRPNEGVFAWQDGEDGDWLALRYDLTAPLARVAAQYRNELAFPYRRYAMGPVWRNEKPGPGRFRQFYQCDADTVGAPSVAADAEMCMMLAEALEAAGIARGDYVIRVNNRKVLNGIIDLVAATHFNGAMPVETVDGILRTLDKFDKVGADGVDQLLTSGRRDSSGAFIPGVGLSEHAARPLCVFLACRESNAKSTLSTLGKLLGDSARGKEGLEELSAISTLCATAGYGPDRVVIDPSVVRGLAYYTGPVFEAELTFEITGEDGKPRRFGSVAGGGRYDDLVRRFTGKQVPATGVSIGVDRLLAALAARGEGRRAAPGPVVVTVMDRARMADYMSLAAKLRAAGIRAEIYQGNPKNFGNQLKYADRRGAPAAVIMGEEEAARGVVQVKDLALGAELAESASLEEWRAQPAQREVARTDLVQAIRAILDRPRP